MGLWRRWFLATTAGEVAGFCVPALIGALMADAPLPVETAALLAAGAVEGGVLGIAQGVVVRRALPAIRARRWAVATAAGAALAWLVAMSGVMLVSAAVPWPVMVPLVALLAAALLLSIGVAQWWLLRGLVPHAGRWIAATAAAWVAALAAFTAFTTPLWRPGQATAVVVAIGVLGGVLMAATMAAITGWAFVSLVAKPGPVAGPSATDQHLFERPAR